MNYYFVLAVPGLDCEIGLANFAPSDPRQPLRNQHVCTARPEHGLWAVDCHGVIAPGAVLALRPADLGLSAEEARSTLVFMSPDRLSGRLPALPRPAGFTSVPSWRAHLRVVSPTTSAGYQGEYPAGMFDIRRPRLVSISAMLQPGLHNALLLACFNGDATARCGSLRINRLRGGEQLMTAPIVCNQVNYVDLSPLLLETAPELLLFSSDDVAGIPIFFCRDAEARQMSLEHTHPPMELMVFGAADARNRVIQKMRSAWMKLVQHG